MVSVTLNEDAFQLNPPLTSASLSSMHHLPKYYWADAQYLTNLTGEECKMNAKGFHFVMNPIASLQPVATRRHGPSSSSTPPLFLHWQHGGKIQDINRRLKHRTIVWLRYLQPLCLTATKIGNFLNSLCHMYPFNCFLAFCILGPHSVLQMNPLNMCSAVFCFEQYTKNAS